MIQLHKSTQNQRKSIDIDEDSSYNVLMNTGMSTEQAQAISSAIHSSARQIIKRMDVQDAINDAKFEKARKHTDDLKEHVDAQFEKARKEAREHTDAQFAEARKHTDAKFAEVKEQVEINRKEAREDSKEIRQLLVRIGLIAMGGILATLGTVAATAIAYFLGL